MFGVFFTLVAVPAITSVLQLDSTRWVDYLVFGGLILLTVLTLVLISAPSLKFMRQELVDTALRTATLVAIAGLFIWYF